MNWLRRNTHRTEDECCGERLSAYLDCELSAEEQAAVERHLEACKDCRWHLETLRQTVEWTRECAPVRLPRVFTIPVETIAPKAVRARRPAWGLPLLQGATALIAVLFALVVAGDLFLGGSAPRSEPQMVALQATTVMDQASTAQQVEVTRVVELAAPAPTVVAEAAVEMAPAQPAAAKAAPTERAAVTAAPAEPITPPPSAPEEPTMTAPAPTGAAEVGGVGGGLPEISVTMEVMAAAVEPSPGLAKAVATSTATVTLAFTAVVPSPTQPLTVGVMLTSSMMSGQAPMLVITPTATASPAAYLATTAGPTRALVDLTAAVPAVETPASAPAPIDTADGEAEQDATTMAAMEEGYNATVPTEAPAALLLRPEPTAIAAAPEARDVEQGDRSGEEQGPVGTLRESVASWFGLAELVLGAAFVLLALATAVVMLRWQPR